MRVRRVRQPERDGEQGRRARGSDSANQRLERRAPECELFARRGERERPREDDPAERVGVRDRDRNAAADRVDHEPRAEEQRAQSDAEDELANDGSRGPAEPDVPQPTAIEKMDEEPGEQQVGKNAGGRQGHLHVNGRLRKLARVDMEEVHAADEKRDREHEARHDPERDAPAAPKSVRAEKDPADVHARERIRLAPRPGFRCERREPRAAGKRPGARTASLIPKTSR